MKNRSKAFKHHQRQRIIQRKLYVLMQVRLDEDMPVKGVLDKGKVHCSCRMCRYEQFHHIPKPKVKAKWLALQQEIDETLAERV